MSITYSEPLELRRAMTVDALWNRHYTKTYRAVTSDPKIGPLAVTRACPVGIGYFYAEGTGLTADSDKGSWVQSISPQQSAEDGRQWDVTVEYGPRQPVDENPLNRKPEIGWSSNVIEEIVDEDLDGAAVVNTAFDSFDPPLTRPIKYPVITVRRNEATYPYELVFELQDGSNAADFLVSGDAKKWKVTIEAQSASIAYTVFGTSTTDTLNYWVVSYTLEYNPRGWMKELLNQGMRQLKSDSTGWEPITDKGQPISSPVLLNSSGRVLAPDGTPIFLEFKVCNEVDFGLLNFSGIDFGEGPI